MTRSLLYRIFILALLLVAVALVGLLIWQWGFASVDTSHIQQKHIGIPYGSVSDTQTLNIYLPNEGTTPYPTIVVIHGGGFMMGNATSGELANMFTALDRGYAVASVNYRLSGEAKFPAAVHDVRAAVRFLKANADRYGLDPDRFAAWGASAGGNLAAMVGTTPQVDELNGDNLENLEYDSSVRAVVDWFGPIHFLEMDAQFAELGIQPILGKTDRAGSPESRYLGKRISTDPDLTRKADPSSYIETLDPESAPSFLIQHGSHDANVPWLQSEYFAKRLKESIASQKVIYQLIDGAGHGTSEFSTQKNLNAVFEFLENALDVQTRSPLLNSGDEANE